MIQSKDLENRAERESEERTSKRGKSSVSQTGMGDTLAQRLALAASHSAPTGACRACYFAGRDAAVRVIRDGGDAPLRELLQQARALRPTHDHGGDPAFAWGRDGVIRALSADV